MTPRPFTWYTIPAGTKPRPCRGSSCEAMIFDIPSEKTPGAKIPLSIEPEGAYAPTSTDTGSGVNHFQDCPDADEFTAARRKR